MNQKTLIRCDYFTLVRTKYSGDSSIGAILYVFSHSGKVNFLLVSDHLFLNVADRYKPMFHSLAYF